MNQLTIIRKDGENVKVVDIIGVECAGGMESQQLFDMLLGRWDQWQDRLAEEKRHSVDLEAQRDQLMQLLDKSLEVKA